MTGRHSPHAPGRPPAGTIARSLTASGALLGRRRARADVWLLLALTALVAVSTLLATAGPRVVARTVDGGVQDAVRAADASSAVTLTASVGTPSAGFSPALTDARDFRAWAGEVRALLPPALGAVVDDATATMTAPPTALLARDGVPDSAADADGEVVVGVAAVPADLELVDGALPGGGGSAEASGTDPAGAPVEVVLSHEAAQAAGLAVGSRVTVAAARGPLEHEGRAAADLLVVGVVAPQDPDAVAWRTVPETWAPVHRDARSDRAAFTRFTVLADDEGLTRLMTFGSVVDGQVRLGVDPTAFTAALAADVAAEIPALRANSSSLSAAGDVAVVVRTGLDTALEEYPPQARAALAQMSVMISGVVGVAGVVLVLLSRLLVVRRAAVLSLERARGASVGAVGLRLLVESALVTAVGLALGLVAAWLLVPGPVPDALPLAVVGLVALLAGPAQAAWLVRR
ncbi:hypothetical protein ICW40_17505, partial [Actinotalea ferrariae]|uniref:hypothetical protein n=1 Tax=Actinotalea ferrariae TaxID=1386098 RepID=UPI001C8CB546